jgi:hypothetical protein
MPPQHAHTSSSHHAFPQAAPFILVVTGAHLSAELYDRPLAYRLREALIRKLADVGFADPHLQVLVCSDVWYLNQDHLRGLPTISIGAPGVNALAAYWADRLPSVMAVDGKLIIQMSSAESGSPVVSCWGADPTQTASAVESFRERWLTDFLDAASHATS